MKWFLYGVMEYTPFVIDKKDYGSFGRFMREFVYGDIDFQET